MMNITIEELNTIKQHWTNGWSRDSEVARAYRDDEEILCIEYKDGSWWHYSEEGEWW